MRSDGVASESGALRLPLGQANLALRPAHWTAVVLLLGLVVRLALAPIGGFGVDVDLFRLWALRLTSEPLSRFYDAGFLADHLPGDLWLMWALAQVVRWLFGPDGLAGMPFVIALKAVAALADVGIGAALYLLGRRLASPKVGLVAASIYILNPASMLLTSIWGQWDPVSMCLVLFALVLMLRGSWEWSLPVYTYALLVKPPFAALSPLVLMYFLFRHVLPHTRFAHLVGCSAPTERMRVPLIRFGAGAGLSIALTAALLLPFSVGLPGMGTRWSLFDRLDYALSIYTYTTLNAFNVWMNPLFGAGNLRPDSTPILLGLSSRAIGMLLTAAALLLTLYMYGRRQRDDRMVVWASLAIVFSLFMLLTRAHERYLFPALPLAALLAALSARMRWFYAALSVSYFLNLYYVYDAYYVLPTWKAMYMPWFPFVMSLVNIALLVYTFLLAPQELGAAPWRGTAAVRLRVRSVAREPVRKHFSGRIAARRQRRSEPALPGGSEPMDRRDYLIVGALVLLGLLMYVPRLSFPSRYIYDEVYHAYTAQQFATGNGDAYVWYTKAPIPNVAYEWTHPPLGKLLIADGILLFGNNSFGWRIASAVIGSIGLAVMYLLLMRLTRRRAVGLLGSGLLLVEGLYFVQSRTGTLDIMIAVFMLAALTSFHWYLSSRPDRVMWPLLHMGLWTGLGLAVKWSAVYATAIMGVIALARGALLGYRWYNRRRSQSGSLAESVDGRGFQQHLIFVPLALIVLPLLVYLGSYTQFFVLGHTWSQLVELQRQMWAYHSGLKATHAYQSQWWSWPMDVRGVWYYVGSFGTKIANIYALGNPLLFWLFVPAVLLVSYIWRGAMSASRTVLLVGFFGQWLPWALSPRIAFMYHFLPAVPFGCAALAVLVYEGWIRGGTWRLVAGAYVAAVVLMFLYLYPIFSGIPIAPSSFDARMLLPTWR